VVFHDAYHYFENRFGLSATAAILVSDASAASAARLSDVKARIAEHGVHCVFSEPQFDQRLIQAVARDVRVAQLDPMGATLAPGPELYVTLIRNLANAMTGCLNG